MIRLKSTFFSFFTALLVLVYTPAGVATQCQTVPETLLISGIAAQVKNADSFLYPNGMSAANAGSHLKFSFESEYLIAESAGILRHYAPHPSLGISKSAWRNMTDEQRISWMTQNLRRVFPEYRSTQTSKLELMDGQPNSFLPPKLILDDTGNIEIVLSPLDTFEQWSRTVSYIFSELGAGSMQGTIGIAKESFLGLSPQMNKAVTQANNIGYLRFVNEFDTFEKLTSGYKRYLADPNKPVAQSFQHAFLGPMTLAKQQNLNTMLDDIANTQKLKFDEIKMAVSENEASFKYFGGTAVRPDLDPKSIVLEVRDCHKNIMCLFERMVRSTNYILKQSSQFSSFSKVDAFDAVESFGKLDSSVQNMLTKIFPIRTKAGVTYTPAETEALKVYRNFAWPLRDFSPLLNGLKRNDLSGKVLSAQNTYKSRLSLVLEKFQKNPTQIPQRSNEVQGALVEFAENSQIFSAMKEFLNNNLL